MQLAYDQVKAEIEVTEFHLTGYSLGAAQAAFVASSTTAGTRSISSAS